MEQVLTNYAYASSRLVTFFVTLFTRLDLGSNNFAWNVVRVCVRDGFYVQHSAGGEARLARIVCFACNCCAYGSLAEFAHAVYNAFHDGSVTAADRELGLVSVTSEFYRLPHEPTCDRAVRSRDNLTTYTDLMFVRRMFAVAYQSNQTEPSGAYQCRVCYARNTDVATVPCGHVYACYECVLQNLRRVANGAPMPCFVCRTPVRAIQQLYFA